MKLIADENFPLGLISELQRNLHNVRRIQRTARSASDLTVVQLAKKENRIIITFDKDFLKIPQKETNPSVMVFDFPKLQPDEITPFLKQILEAISQLRKRKRPFLAIYSEKGLEII